MIFWLLNTLVIAWVLVSATKSLPEKYTSNFLFQFSLGLTCWAIGFASLAIYPKAWLEEQTITDDEYAYEDSECIKAPCS